MRLEKGEEGGGGEGEGEGGEGRGEGEEGGGYREGGKKTKDIVGLEDGLDKQFFSLWYCTLVQYCMKSLYLGHSW